MKCYRTHIIRQVIYIYITIIYIYVSSDILILLMYFLLVKIVPIPRDYFLFLLLIRGGQQELITPTPRFQVSQVVAQEYKKNVQNHKLSNKKMLSFGKHHFSRSQLLSPVAPREFQILFFPEIVLVIFSLGGTPIKITKKLQSY